jgi:hypothetical protein
MITKHVFDSRVEVGWDGRTQMNPRLVVDACGLGSSRKEIFRTDAGSFDPLKTRGRGRPTSTPSASVLRA